MSLEVVLLLAAPLVLAATGELLLERAGSIQIGLEGTMLLGAFAAYAAATKGAGPYGALVAGGLAGLAAGLLFALFAVVRRADPILVGTAWNLLAAGLSGFGYRLLAGDTGTVFTMPSLEPGSLPRSVILGGVFLAPVAVHLFLTRSRPGLLLIAAGETPAAVLAVGQSVVRVRSVSAAVNGLLAGSAGALLLVTISPSFVEGVTAGRGFLALAIVVFARWKPLLLVPGALLIGGATALSYRLQAGGATGIPYAVFLALPPLLALAALSVVRSASGAPRALGRPAP